MSGDLHYGPRDELWLSPDTLLEVHTSVAGHAGVAQLSAASLGDWIRRFFPGGTPPVVVRDPQLPGGVRALMHMAQPGAIEATDGGVVFHFSQDDPATLMPRADSPGHVPSGRGPASLGDGIVVVVRGDDGVSYKQS